MSKMTVIIRYDGPALAGHAMDADYLAPALMGLSILAKKANRQLNGEESSLKVFVRVEQEQKCFQFVIEVIQSFVQQADLLSHDEELFPAKEVCELLGLLGGSTFGLFKLYKWLAREKVPLSELDVHDGDGNVILRNIKNNGSITVQQNTFQLARDSEVTENIKEVVRPLTKSGYEKLQFEENNEITEEINAEEGLEIFGMEVDSNSFHRRVNAFISRPSIKVKRPDLLGNSKWTFVLDKAFEAKIEDIAWLGRYHKAEVQVPPGSYLSVVLRTEIKLDVNNDPFGDPSYYVVEVLEVVLPEKQAELFDPEKIAEDAE